MTDVEHALDSADQCIDGEIDKGLGAGSNAGSGEDMVLITTTPLSELVWSQHRGLGLQYVASSLADKKASLLWNTDSFGVMISSPQCANVGESCNTRYCTGGDPNLLQLKPNTEEQNCKNGTLVGTPRSTIGRQPLSIRICEQICGSFGDMELLKRSEEVVLDKEHERDNHLDNKEVGICLPENNKSFDILMQEADAVNINQSDNKEVDICSPGNHKSSDIFRPEIDAVDEIHHKDFIPGDNCGPSAEYLFCNLKELRPDLARVEVESASNIRTSPDRFKGLGQKENNQTSGLAIVSAHQDSVLAKYGSPIKLASNSGSAECREADLAADTAEDYTTSRILQHLTSLNTFSRQCSGDVQSLDFGCRNEGRTPLVSQLADEGKDGNWQASHRDNSPLIGSLSDCNMNNLIQGKGKELFVSDTEERESISKENEDSHESVESSNSKRPISKGKRPWSYYSKMSVESKRLKKESNEGSCSGSFLRKDSSFMNWISTITNGFSSSNFAASLAIVPQPSLLSKGNLDCPPMSHDGSKEIGNSCRNMGFKSIFQALYRPGLGVENSTMGDLDHQRESDASKELKFANEQFGHGTCHILSERLEFNLHNMGPSTSKRVDNASKDNVSGDQFNIDSLHIVCDSDGVKLHNEVSMSSERLNQGTRQVVEFSSTNINTSFTDSRFHKKTKYDVGQTCKLSKTGSTSSFAKNGSQSPSVGKGTGIIVAVSDSSPNLITNSRSGFLENLWITRLSPKVSAPIPNSIQCNHDMDVATESLTNNSTYAASNKEQKNSKSCCLPSLEGHRDVVDCKAQEHMICPTASLGLRREVDQKLKSKLNPILPSQRVKNIEPIASNFAKRLDALRHINPSEAPNDVTSATTTCFFCGRSGHCIRECSELVETELEDLLKNMNSCDGRDKSSCLCIRCFQLNHWAISCPYASSKGKHVNQNSLIVSNENGDKAENKPINHSSANCDGRIILWSGGKHEEHQLVSGHKIPRRGNGELGTEFVVHSNVSTSMGNVGAPNAVDLYSNPVKENIGGSAVKVKPTSSSSGENESMGNQFIPFCNYVNTEVSDESIGLFETVRRLRLSRTDIIRWMKSPNSHFILEGFFLRLRLGKWEKGFGGTGYHVAYINGASCENCLSVCIGGLTCLVDCRFISNHDFIEDELKAWWSATLKDRGKLPLREELNKKLQERTKFGF